MTWTPDPGFDFALFGRDQRLVAVVEAKAKKNTSPAWAAQLRRNMLAHGHAALRSDFFLIATPDKLYMWRGAADERTAVPPLYTIDAQPLFGPYFERAGVRPEGASPPAFELAIAAWLGDLVRAAEPREKLAAEQPWLVESGFVDAINGGHIEYAAAA